MNVRNFVRIMVAVAIAVMSIAGTGGMVVAAPAGSITGYVQTDNGTPIAGARVDAWEWDDATHEGFDITDGVGNYTITGLRTEDYRVKASADGYNAYYYPGVLRTGDAQMVQVVDGQATVGKNFSLVPGKKIEGHVYQEDNVTASIQGARVSVWENITDSGTWKYLAGGSTNPEGLYSITAFSGPGSYKVRAEKMGWAGEFWDNVTSIYPEDGDPVLVTADDDTLGIDFYLAQSGYVSGTVYEADGETPLGGATITARDNTTQDWIGYTRSVSGTGFYYINLDPGTYRILTTAPGHMPQWWDNFTVVSGDSPYTQSWNWNNADPISVVGTSETPGKDFNLLTVQAVATSAATGIGTTSATLNGNLTSKGANDNVTVSFEWGTAPGVYTGTTDNQTMTDTGAFSAPLSGLTPNTPYYFIAKAVGDLDTVPFYGSELTFTTNPLGAPAVTTDNATGISTTSATLNGTLDDLGTAASVTVSFEWGTDTSYSGTPTTPVARDATGTFSAPLSGLSPNTTYHFRAKAVGDGTDFGDDVTFTTSTTPPSVTTNDASSLATTSATLNGNLTALGTATAVNVSFEWGLTTSYGSVAAGTPPSMSLPGNFSANLTGLTAKTTYHFRAIAAGDGTTPGADATFTTSTIAPSVTTGAATNPATTSATLNGNLTLKGTASSVIVSFEWGTATGSYTQTTDNQTLSAAGAFSANLSGLTPGTTYYYKAKAVGDATVRGDEMSFTALTTPPTVTTSAASSLAATSASLNGNLTALGTAASVTVSFEWGTTVSYGSETSAQSVSATGAFSASLTGLTANTTYHFRTKAVGHGAAVYGTDMTFSTADTIAPTISLVTSSGITTTSATITWSTSEAATTQVKYGLTEEYDLSTTEVTTLVTGHSVNLTGLKAGKTYHYQVISKDAANNQAVSADATFTTASPSGGMPVWAWVLIGLAAVGVAGAVAFLIRGRLKQG